MKPAILALFILTSSVAFATQPCSKTEFAAVSDVRFLEKHIKLNGTFSVKEVFCSHLTLKGSRQLTAILPVLDIKTGDTKNNVRYSSVTLLIADRSNGLNFYSPVRVSRSELGPDLATFALRSQLETNPEAVLATIDIDRDGNDEIVFNIGQAQATELYIFKLNDEHDAIKALAPVPSALTETHDFFMGAPDRLPRLDITRNEVRVTIHTSSIAGEASRPQVFRLTPRGQFVFLGQQSF